MSKTIYQRRRRDLMNCIDDGIAIVTTAHHQQRNGDTFYRFRPDSDFFYLTHFPEPEAVAVFVPGRSEGEFLLFCRESNPERELWDGRRAGLEGAVSKYGADQAFAIDQLHQKLPELLDNRDKVFTMMGRYPEFDSELINCINTVRSKIRSGAHAPGEYIDLRHIIHEMRIIKKKDELKMLRAAARLAASGHRRADGLWPRAISLGTPSSRAPQAADHSRPRRIDATPCGADGPAVAGRIEPALSAGERRRLRFSLAAL